MPSLSSPPNQHAASLARDANTRAGRSPTKSRYRSVEINPQFCVIRTFADLNSTVRAIHDGPLPPRCTVYDGVRPEELANAYSHGHVAIRSQATTTPAGAAAPAAKATAATTAAGCSTTVGTASASPSAPHPDNEDALSIGAVATPIGPSPHSVPSSSQAGNLNTRFALGTGPLQTGAQWSSSTNASPPPVASPHKRPSFPAAARKVLCIWDVDDTLVASGAAGTRQNVLFPASELVSLFKALPGTRHILLSQGSIDDVFYPNRGRLRFLQRYFSPGSTAADKAAASTSDTESERGGKPKRGGGIFSCGGTKEKTPHKPDITSFEHGTALIRLSTVRGCEEESSDSDFLYDANAKPKLHGDEKHDQIRWLVLRPSTWGITLATLNSLFAPSETTACVDGKVFHKMDVAWSLARSGLWDAVFFIDNNLSEVGVVKYGMHMEHVLELRQTHSLNKFFHAEFLLLAASAKVRQLEKQHGRDVTVPPEGWASSVNNSHTDINGKVNGCSSNEDANVLAARDEADRLKVLTTTVCDGDADTKGMNGSRLSLSSSNSSKLGGAPRASHGASTAELIAPLATTTTNTASQQPSGLLRSRNSAAASAGRCRQVDLVVAHLHIPSEVYRRVLLGNRSGTSIGTRNVDVMRSTGQPTFVGDSSLSDDQYDAVLAMFCLEESSMYQLMDEDMRSNGFVETCGGRKWSPKARYVHMTIFNRPSSMPHLRAYYEKIARETEERVVGPLLRGEGSIKGASVIRSNAHIICTQLLRAGPFLDPLAQGALALELYMVYTAEGNVTKASGECVHRAVNKLIDEPKRKVLKM